MEVHTSCKTRPFHSPAVSDGLPTSRLPSHGDSAPPLKPPAWFLSKASMYVYVPSPIRIALGCDCSRTSKVRANDICKESKRQMINAEDYSRRLKRLSFQNLLHY